MGRLRPQACGGLGGLILTVRLSIIITCYKEGAYLRDCLASARHNLGPGIELIIVNDASPDPVTNAVCREAEAAGIRVLTHAHNGGASAARNTGARWAEGDILFFVDGDDLLPEGTVAAAVDFLAAHPECDFVCGDYSKIDADGRPLETVSMAEVSRGIYIDPDLLMRNWTLLGCSPMRRTLFERTGGYDESPWITSAAQDVDFYRRALDAGAKGGRIDRLMYRWRMHTTNIHKTLGAVSWPLMNLKNRKILARHSGRTEAAVVSASLHSLYAHGDTENFRRFYRSLFRAAGWKNHARRAAMWAGLRVGRPQSPSRVDLSAAEFRGILDGTTPAPREHELLEDARR